MKLLKLLSAGATLLGSVSSGVLSQPDRLPRGYGASHQTPNTPTSMYHQEGTVWSLKFNIDKNDDGVVYDQKTGGKIGYVHLDCQDSCVVKNDRDECIQRCEVGGDVIKKCGSKLKVCRQDCIRECGDQCCVEEKQTCEADCDKKDQMCVDMCAGDGSCEADCKEVTAACYFACREDSEMCETTCKGLPCESNCSRCENKGDLCFTNCDEDKTPCLGPCVEACTEPGEVNTCSLEFETTRGNFDIGGNFESLKSLISEKDGCQFSNECEIESCVNCESDRGIKKYDYGKRMVYELEVLSLFGTTCTPPNSNDVRNEPIFFLDVEFGKRFVSSDVLYQPDHLPWRYGASDQAPNIPKSMYQKTQEGNVLSLKFNVDKYDDGTVYNQKSGKKIGYVHLDCQNTCIVKNDLNECISQCKVNGQKLKECKNTQAQCVKDSSAVCVDCCGREEAACLMDCDCASDCDTCEFCDDCCVQCKALCKKKGNECNTFDCPTECEPSNCTPCQEKRNVFREQCDEAFIDCFPPCVGACVEPGEVDQCSLEFETTRGDFDITGSFESLKSLIFEKDCCQFSSECEIKACLNCESDRGIKKYDYGKRSVYELEVLSLFGTTCTPPNSNDVRNEPTFFLDVEYGKEKRRSLKHSRYDYNNQPQPQYVYQQPMTYTQQAPFSTHYGGQQQSHNAHQQWQYAPAQPQHQPSGHYANRVQPVYTQQHYVRSQSVGYNNYETATYGQ